MEQETIRGIIQDLSNLILRLESLLEDESIQAREDSVTYSVTEASERLNRTERTLYRWMRNRKLVYQTVGGRIRIPERSILEIENRELRDDEIGILLEEK